MASDEPTNIENDVPIVRGQSARDPLPWVLFIATLTAFIGTTVFLVLRSRSETDRANTEYAEKSQAEARATQAEEALDGEKLRSKDLAVKLDAITAERDALVKAKAAETTAAARATAKKPVAVKKPVKKPVPVKRRK